MVLWFAAAAAVDSRGTEDKGSREREREWELDNGLLNCAICRDEQRGQIIIGDLSISPRLLSDYICVVALWSLHSTTTFLFTTENCQMHNWVVLDIHGSLLFGSPFKTPEIVCDTESRICFGKRFDNLLSTMYTTTKNELKVFIS